MKKRPKEKLAEAIEHEAAGQYFCPLPFEHLYNDSAGRWRLCCRAYPFDHTVSDATPEEHWGHPIMQAIRREMLSGDLKQVRKHCWKCLKVEKEGAKIRASAAQRQAADMPRRGQAVEDLAVRRAPGPRPGPGLSARGARARTENCVSSETTATCAATCARRVNSTSRHQSCARSGMDIG